MGVVSFFRRVKNFFWGILWMLLGIGGAVGLLESDWGEPPMSYIVLALGGGIAIYGLIHVIKAFGKNGDAPIEKDEKPQKSEKKEKKDVRKVWQMQYVGKGRQDQQGLVVQVPSSQQSGGPAPKELLEAIKDLGFDDATAHALWNGMSSSDWKVLS